jgi:hypothetical protein
VKYLPNGTLGLLRTTPIPRAVLLIALSVLVGCSDRKEAASQDIIGKYRIVKAYALIHDQGSLREVETGEAGVMISIDGNSVTASEERHQIEKREKLTGDEFRSFHAGMNYRGVGKEIFGKIPEDAKITLLHLDHYSATDLIGSNIFSANGWLLIDAAGEFVGDKSWASDMYFYLAERM